MSLHSKNIGFHLNFKFSEKFVVKTIFIHPDYVKGQNKNANIAVLHVNKNLKRIESNFKFDPFQQTEKEFNKTLISPRVLGQFPAINESGTNCVLQWGPTTSDKADIVLHNPETCDSGAPKVFCSVVTTANDDKCSKYQGATIVCGDAAATAKHVDGILLNNGTCDGISPSFRLLYHSIGEYSEWIQKVSGADDMKRTSSLLLVASAILVAIRNIV